MCLPRVLMCVQHQSATCLCHCLCLCNSLCHCLPAWQTVDCGLGCVLLALY
jgi:hypothetical protein